MEKEGEVAQKKKHTNRRLQKENEKKKSLAWPFKLSPLRSLEGFAKNLERNFWYTKLEFRIPKTQIKSGGLRSCGWGQQQNIAGSEEQYYI